MNKFKVPKDLYKCALNNKNKELESQISELICKHIYDFTNSGIFIKPSKNEIKEYSDKLNDIDYKWDMIENEEFYVSLERSRIKNNVDIIEALDLVIEDYFDADDETLLFIYRYSQI
jgi:hypothetical protein